MFNNQIIAGSSGAQGGGSFYSYSIDQSLRFNKSDSPRLLDSSVASDGNRKKFTFSFWIKRTELETYDIVIGAGGSGSYPSAVIGFHSHRLTYKDYRHPSYTSDVITTAVFRDVSAWYHFVVAVDTTQSTAADRVKMYVNGTQLTDFDSTSYPSQNYDTLFQDSTSGNEPTIGYAPGFDYMNGYLADVYNVDNAQLAPTDFGETSDGVWIPKQYSGSFGTTGYHLTFSDSSSIGADSSGNSHSFDTVTNLSAIDVVPDSPTNNFATANPIAINTSGAWTTNEGNLKIQSSTNNKQIRGTFLMQSGKWYWETRRHNANNNNAQLSNGVGISLASGYIENNPYQSSTNWSYYSHTGSAYHNNTATSYGDSWNTAGDIVGVAFDADNGAIWFSKNGTWQNSATASEIAAGTTTNAAYTGLTSTEGYVCVWWRTGGNNAVEMDINFGQNPSFNEELTGGDVGTESGDGGALFKYPPPTGFKALTTSNMPDITIGPGQSSQAGDHFNTVLFTGNGGTNAITGVGFQPDWVWIKSRNNAQGHLLTDSVRGATKRLQADTTAAEDTSTGVASFDSDGFTMGSSYNQSSYNQVSWNWKGGGSASSNSDGSVTSQVSANTDAGFSIVTWTADADNGTVGHGLNSAPEMILAKPLGSGTNWYVMHTPGGVVPANNVLNLDNNSAAFNPGVNHFNDTYPTSTVFSYGGYLGDDLSNDDKVAYCFHGVEGYCKVGSFYGNGNSSGTYVYTGFRPAWVMIKRSSASENWRMQDSKRLGYNPEGKELYADLGLVEASNYFDILSNGFKIRNTSNGYNASGSTYIYLAFATAPFKFANAR